MREKPFKYISKTLSSQERLCMRAGHQAAMKGMNDLFIKKWKEAKTPEERAEIEEKQDNFILGYIARPNW